MRYNVPREIDRAANRFFVALFVQQRRMPIAERALGYIIVIASAKVDIVNLNNTHNFCIVGQGTVVKKHSSFG